MEFGNQKYDSVFKNTRDTTIVLSCNFFCSSIHSLFIQKESTPKSKEEKKEKSKIREKSSR